MNLSLDEERINEELGKKMLELRHSTNEESGTELLKEINELNKKKEEIKNGRLSIKK